MQDNNAILVKDTKLGEIVIAPALANELKSVIAEKKRLDKLEKEIKGKIIDSARELGLFAPNETLNLGAIDIQTSGGYITLEFNVKELQEKDYDTYLMYLKPVYKDYTQKVVFSKKGTKE